MLTYLRLRKAVCRNWLSVCGRRRDGDAEMEGAQAVIVREG